MLNLLVMGQDLQSVTSESLLVSLHPIRMILDMRSFEVTGGLRGPAQWTFERS